MQLAHNIEYTGASGKDATGRVSRGVFFCAEDNFGKERGGITLRCVA
jgi:hypothetical protein